MEVPFFDLRLQNRSLKKEVLTLWEEIIDCAHFIGGPHVEGFEREFALACEVEYCICVNSGTDALRFILLSMGLNPGDEVITVPNTFIATAEAISQAGAKIKFIDIDPNTYNIDPKKIESAISTNTRGIVPVHLYGQTADMDPISAIAKKHDLWIVEDSCQAHLAEFKGKKAGSMGLAAAFSFYPGKNLGACGEGGAVTTNNADIANKVRMLRDHGQTKKYFHDIEGYNGRCDALQAAALRVKLKHLPHWNEARRKNARLYRELLKDNQHVILPTEAIGCLPVYHLFVIQVNNRDQVAKTLNKMGIGIGLHYPIPLHLQKAYKYMKIPEGSLPVTEACAKKLLSLPMYPELTEEQISYVCKNLKMVTVNSF